MNMYNPMLDYQRNNLMAQQQLIQNQLNQLNMQNNMGQQPSFNPRPQSQQSQYFVKQIGSIDEAKAFPVEPGIIYLFPDTGTGKIYLKMMNVENGKSETYIYSPSQESEVVVEAKDPNESILRELDEIKKSIGGLYESISSNAGHKPNDEKPYGSDATTNAGENAKARPSKVQSN